ncbi:MAG: putative oxidoreductase [Actinomycetota bacterium]|nr:putative oxidoreductase [Actinomycetota bacterium]
MLRDLTLLGARVVVGAYMAGHGAQKLFGALGGHGLEGTGQAFEQMGLTPGREMAAVAGATELGSGVLIAAGLGGALGPVAAASTMAVAAGTAHRGKGAFAMTGGPELSLVDLASAAAIGAVGPGRFSLDAALHTRVPGALVAAAVLGSAAAAAYLICRSVEHERRQAAPQSTETDAVTAPEPADESVAAVHHFSPTG